MLVLPGKGDDLFDLGGGDVLGEDTTDPHALSVHLEHHPRCPFAVHSKKFLQDDYDEIHRSEVVVEQKHLVKRRRLRPRSLGFEEGVVLFLSGHAIHSNGVEAECNTATTVSILGRTSGNQEAGYCVARTVPARDSLRFREGSRKGRIIDSGFGALRKNPCRKKLLTPFNQVRKSRNVRRAKCNAPELG